MINMDIGAQMERLFKTLIVDDSKALCQVLREHLLHYGITLVHYCHSGEHALEEITKHHYDAIFVDLHMPGMDGLELMSHLNDLHYKGGVVIVSALDNRIVEYTLEVVSNFNLRVLGSIEKPIERSLVAFMVRRIRSAHSNTPSFDQLPKRREVLKALEDGSLKTYFQPIVNGYNSTVHSLECLARLEIPSYGILAPKLFLPIIDRFKLHELFLKCLFEKAGPAYRNIKKETDIRGKLAINLSPKELFDDDLPKMLTEHAEAQGLGSESLGFEITEDYSLTDEQQQKNLSRLRIHGFELSLDDYGAGFTNLRQITTMPFNEIKLDAELINGMHKDRILRIIVESISKVTQELQLNLVAEGISNPHDLISLDDIGIHLYQGFFFARPKPEDEFIRWLKQWRKAMEVSKAVDEKLIDVGINLKR